MNQLVRVDSKTQERKSRWIRTSTGVQWYWHHAHQVDALIHQAGSLRKPRPDFSGGPEVAEVFSRQSHRGA